LLRSSLDDIMQLQRQQQQQQLLQQQHGVTAKQAWGTAAPSGKLLPPLDSNSSQVRRPTPLSNCLFCRCGCSSAASFCC
jgi:hypothetical protein